MNCDRVQDLLSEAIDGTLSPAESGSFHAHLAGCVACRTSLAELRDSLALLTELPAVQPREGFDEAVWTLIRAEHRAVGVGLRHRLIRVLDELASAGGWMRWAPLGAAASLLAWVAVSPMPPAGERAVAGTGGAAETAAEFVASGTAETVDPRFKAVEYSGAAPEPIERYLESRAAASRDLGLSAETYRRSNWHYPLTPVADPVNVIPVAESVRGVPVGEPPRSEFEAGSRIPEANPGVPVLSF